MSRERRMHIPRDLKVEVLNAAARLGVEPKAVIRAALRKQLDLIREDEAAACEDTEMYEAWKRRRDANRAKELLSQS